MAISLVSVPPVRSPRLPFVPKLMPCVRLLVLPLLLCAQSALAQPDLVVTRLLFEPVLLTTEGAPPDRTIISISDAEADMPLPASEERPLSLDERRAIEADIEQYIARIGDSEAEAGPYSDQLREDLFNTGKLYQELDDHENAVKLFERTLAVSRINYGLEGLDQVPIMETMAQSYLELDKLSDADAMMTAAYNLQEKVYGADSPQLVPALMKIGEWNTTAFMDRSSILVNIPRMNVQNFLTDPKNYIQPQQDIRNTPLWNLYQARGNYLNAIGNLIFARDFNNPSLLGAERELLTNYFLFMHRENILYEPDFYLTRKKSKTASRLNQNAIELMNSESYDLGKEAHKRTRSYLFNDPNVTGTRLALAMLEEADWDLLFERKTNAFDKYEELYKFFELNPELKAEAMDLLYPEVPVVLPTYLPPPNSREKLGIPADADVSYFGYMDVSLNLTKFGKARRVKIVGKNGDITRNMEIRLNQYLRNVLFRPRFTGTEVNTEPFMLRYYVGM